MAPFVVNYYQQKISASLEVLRRKNKKTQDVDKEIVAISL